MSNAAREIENLLYRYAELIDDGDLAAVAELFRHGSIVGPDGSESRGYDEVLALYSNSTRLYPDTGTPCTQHVTTNARIEVDEATHTAECHSRFTVLQALPDFPLQTIIAGRYRDRFERVEGRWRFTRREMHPTLFGDLSRHLLFDADTLK